MNKQKTLESLILDHVQMGRAGANGFHPIKCAECNDYKARGGFIFSNGSIGYSCFNCGAAYRYEEFSGALSRKFRKLLVDFGVPEIEISSLLFMVRTGNKEKEQPEQEKITLKTLTANEENTAVATISQPEDWIPLLSTDHEEHSEYQLRLIDYLEKRGIAADEFPFFFSMNDRMKNRIIIPFYRKDRLIYWQARSIDPNEKKRYDQYTGPRKAVLFNHDKLFEWSNAPLFICEGVFDALPVYGIATLTSSPTKAQISLLKKSKRRLVFVIDKDSNGKNFADAALQNGWDIVFTEQGTDDIGESIEKYGLLFTYYQLMREIIPSGSKKADLYLMRYCKRSKKNNE